MNKVDLRYFQVGFLILAYFAISPKWLTAQCVMTDINGEIIEIKDFTTVGLKFIVQDNVHNDLSDPLQGICGVRLAFSHRLISDVRMQLIAPDGSRVTLIGPATFNGTTPALFFPINHDLLFVPSTAPTVLDPGTSDRWTNSLPTWATLANYNGTYHPNAGDLNLDLITGPIDGIWELRVEDDFLNDEGIIESFELIFCDPSSISCDVCEADAGTYTDPISGCVGEDIPDSLWQAVSNSDISEYTLFYLLQGAGSTSRIDPSFNFENLAEGDYKINAITVLNEDRDDVIDEIDQGILFDSIQIALEGRYCFDVTNQPLNLSIDAPDTVQVVATYCTESPTFYQGIKVNHVDTIITLLAPDCSEYRVVSFEVSTVDAVLPFDTLFLGCDDFVLDIDGSSSDLGVAGNVSWTWNGVSQAQSDLIIQGDLGEHVLVIEDQGCISRDCVQVISQLLVVDYDFTVNGIITCTTPEIGIEIVQKNSLEASRWTGPGIVSNATNVEQIQVNQPGIYSVTYRDTAGCGGLFEEFEILADIVFPEFNLITDSIRCNHPDAEIEVVSPDPGVSANWQLGEGLVQDSRTFSASESDSLYIEVFAENGCTIDTAIFIRIDTNSVNIFGQSDTLDCINSEVVLSANTSGTGINFEWSDTDVIISTNSSITVNLPDAYTLIASKNNECSDTALFTVILDREPPGLMTIQDSVINCLVDSAVLQVVVNQEASVLWGNPDFINVNDPRQVVFDGGTFGGTITSSSNGCTDEFEFEVMRDIQEPIFIVETVNIDCEHPVGTFNIIADPADDVQLLINNNPPLVQTGYQSSVGVLIDYVVTGSNGCAVQGGAIIEQNDVPPEILVSDSIILNCNASQVIINPQVDPVEVVDLFFVLPNGDTVRVSELKVSTSGQFEVIAISQSGCLTSKLINVSEDIEVPSVELSISEGVKCDQTEMQINLHDLIRSNDVTWNWNLHDNAAVLETDSISILSGDGLFILELLNSVNGCSSMDTFVLAFSSTPFMAIDFSSIDEICSGENNGMIDELMVDGGEGQVNITINEDLVQNVDLTSLQPGSYVIRAEDELSCFIDTSLVINKGNRLEFELGDDLVLLPGENIVLNPNIIMDGNSSIIEWTLGGSGIGVNSTSLDIRPSEEGKLTLQIIDEKGCEFSDNILITIVQEFDELFYVPNVFYPSSSIGNAFVTSSFSERIATINSFNIYDRWGELIYTINNFLPGQNISLWDGRINNTDAISGVYVYRLEVTLSNGSTEVATGDITLIR